MELRIARIELCQRELERELAYIYVQDMRSPLFGYSVQQAVFEACRQGTSLEGIPREPWNTNIETRHRFGSYSAELRS